MSRAPDRDAALAVTARLLARHHRLPGEKRIEAAARREQARREALADQATLRKAAERGEAVADDGRSVAARVRCDGDDARRQATARQRRIGEARDRHGALADVEDSHARTVRPAAARTRPSARRFGAGALGLSAAAPISTPGAPNDRAARRDEVPQPVRRADARGRRGLGGDVSVLPPLRSRAARGRGEALLVLQRHALPGADAGLRHDHGRVVLPLDRPLPGPRVPDPDRARDRAPRRQRLRLHHGQRGQRPGRDREAARGLPAADRLLLPELGHARGPLAGRGRQRDRGAHGARGADACPRSRTSKSCCTTTSSARTSG